jgi:hypothetical protein
MQLVAGAINGKYLLDIHHRAINRTDAVRAAVAYAGGETRIIDDCQSNNIPLIFWGRFDASLPVALPILKKFLDAKSPGLVCKLIPDIFHPKVVWWQGAGVYIGSANLTANGWFGNIEAGIYLEDSELAEQGLDEELETFFAEIDQRSFPLTAELYEDLETYIKRYNQVRQKLISVEEQFDRSRRLPPLSPLTYVNVSTVLNERKRGFAAEWSKTLQELRNIGDRVSSDNHRPNWIAKSVPKGVQADQFLHAFYYNQVREGVRSRHYEFHERNRRAPEQALIDAMLWWRSLSAPPSGENVTIEEWAPFIRKNLARDKLLTLNRQEFTQVCERIHALRDHALRVRKETLGLPANSDVMRRKERVRLLSDWLYQQRSPEGETVLHTIDYVLFGGPRQDLPNRIWDATHNDKWKIPHFGVSTIGELVGWALPDDFPPRNGRTSKALFALGYQVTIHSE